MDTLTATQRHIREISEIEKQALTCRSHSERFGDWLASQAGRMWFITLHAIWFGVWIIVNTFKFFGFPLFDPFPFALLTMVVSLEAIFLSLFILMSQNRATHQSEQRAHLDLQINLLAEQESTKMLQMLQALCTHHGLSAARDPEIDELAKRTDPGEVLNELRNSLPDLASDPNRKPGNA